MGSPVEDTDRSEIPYLPLIQQGEYPIMEHYSPSRHVAIAKIELPYCPGSTGSPGRHARCAESPREMTEYRGQLMCSPTTGSTGSDTEMFYVKTSHSNSSFGSEIPIVVKYPNAFKIRQPPRQWIHCGHRLGSYQNDNSCDCRTVGDAYMQRAVLHGYPVNFSERSPTEM